jgi:hypothetical protein
MSFLVAIVVYGCEIAGQPAESTDLRVRYFDSQDLASVEDQLRKEPAHEYVNGEGETVSWPFLRIASMELVDDLKHGDEIAGFITNHDGFGQWARDDVA